MDGCNLLREYDLYSKRLLKSKRLMLVALWKNLVKAHGPEKPNKEAIIDIFISVSSKIFSISFVLARLISSQMLLRRIFLKRFWRARRGKQVASTTSANGPMIQE